MKKVRLFEQFTANKNVNEAVAKNTKVYQIATPAPKAMLVGELEDLFGDDYRHIVTEFDDNEGYESVLVFNLTKNDIKRIQEEIGDVLIWEYSIKKGKAISESLVNEAFIGPFVFNDKMSDDELKAMYDGAIDGYAYYAKGMQYPKSDYKKAYQEIEKILKKRGVVVNEAKLSVIHKAAKKGSYPVSIVVIRDGKVIAQELVKTPAEVPAAFNVIQSYHKHKGATVHIESKTGERLFSESLVTESVFAFKTDNIEQLHFETDPKTAEEMKIELGKKQGEVSKRKQIESGEYSLRRFRKEIGYGNGKDVGVFLPGSYDASISKLGDGPHKKAVKAVKWNQKKYDQWLEDMASNGGAENAFDMAQNAKNERGLIDWLKKNFRGDDPMQRIQWDIEAFA